MLRHSLSIVGALATVLFVAAPETRAATSASPAVTAAVADASRPDADRQRDADRKPADVIAFAGIKSGDRVADLLPGGGYFTRIFSKVVGPSGVVYAVPPPPRPNVPAGAPDPAAAVNAIAADASYKNVRVHSARPTELTTPEPVDVVWTSLNYHDVHNIPNADIAAFNKSIFNVLKPGGTYIVIDHAAAAGSGGRDTSTLHRIDPELVKTEVTSVGFVLDGESDALRNVQDPHTAGVRDASVKGRTDQLVLKFRKPAK